MTDEVYTAEDAPIGVRLQNVMLEIKAVGKDSTSKGGDGAKFTFKFRGIDAVVQEVKPHFAKHGISITKRILHVDYENVKYGTGSDAIQVRAQVLFRYTSAHNSEDFREDEVIAEAMDSGDKATAKVLSVALRTSLLQVLLIPTGDPDPDEDQYQRTHGANSDGRGGHQRPWISPAQHNDIRVKMETAQTLEGLEAARLETAPYEIGDDDVETLRLAYVASEVRIRAAKRVTEGGLGVTMSAVIAMPATVNNNPDTDLREFGTTDSTVIDALQLIQTRLNEAKTVKEAVGILMESKEHELVFPSSVNATPITLKEVFEESPPIKAERENREERYGKAE